MKSFIRVNVLWLLLSSALAFGQGGSVVRQVIAPTTANNGTGQPASYAIVTVCPSTSSGTPCSPLTANLYSDQALTEPVANPTAADVNGNYNFFLPSGTYLIQESSALGAGYSFGYSWLVYVNATGTVSSISLAMPSIFTVSGSPITSSGTITVGLNAATANSVFGNCSNSLTVPSFCSLIASQIPSTLNATDILGLSVTGNANVTSNLTVSGNETLLGTNLNMTGGILAAQGVQAGSSGLSVTGTSSLAGLNVSGSAALSGGGSLAGNFSGGPVFTGTPIFDGANFVNGFQLNGSYGTNGYCLVSTGSGTTFAPGCGLGGTPNLVIGPGAGAGAGFVLTPGSKDKAGGVAISAGSGSSTLQTIVTVTYSVPFPTASFCVISPYATASTAYSAVVGVVLPGSFQILTNTVSGLVNGNGYNFDYHCDGY